MGKKKSVVYIYQSVEGKLHLLSKEAATRDKILKDALDKSNLSTNKQAVYELAPEVTTGIPGIVDINKSVACEINHVGEATKTIEIEEGQICLGNSKSTKASKKLAETLGPWVEEHLLAANKGKDKSFLTKTHIMQSDDINFKFLDKERPVSYVSNGNRLPWEANMVHDNVTIARGGLGSQNISLAKNPNRLSLGEFWAERAITGEGRSVGFETLDAWYKAGAFGFDPKKKILSWYLRSIDPVSGNTITDSTFVEFVNNLSHNDACRLAGQLSVLVAEEDKLLGYVFPMMDSNFFT